MEQKYLLAFDCMETLIDMTELPSHKCYAKYAFEGSGVEHYWSSLDEFYRHHREAERNFYKNNPEYTEFSKIEMLRDAVRLSKTPEYDHLYTTQALFNNFWRNYLERCYCSEDVYQTIRDLEKKGYFMVVVSNFTVPNGVHEMLSKVGLLESFMRVYSSADIGMRKPSKIMFDRIVKDFRITPDRVILFGDDYEADYVGGAGYGFKTCLYDRDNKYPQVKDRVKSFSEYVKYLEDMDML